MAAYFPRETVHWKLEEPAAFRRLSLSVIEMGLITGIVVRLYRSLVLTHGSPDSWLYLGIGLGVGIIFLCGMLTLHLGNFTVKHWLWRVPAFAAVELGAEMLTSLALIALGREPLGSSARARMGDWPPMVGDTLLIRWLILFGYALLLAGIVTLIQHFLMDRKTRDTMEIEADAEVQRIEDEHGHPQLP